jgi:nucleoside-diphosphate-sugar epimerase
MSKTVAIFGAGGKLGQRALALLAQRGWPVRALVHRTPVTGPGVTSIPGSITDPGAVEETVRGADLVVQLATTKEDADTFFDVSVKGTFHVLEACRKQGVEQFLLLGGDAAYGIWFYPQPIPIDENHPLTAYPGYYAFSKVMEETMAQQYAVQYGVPVTVLRSSWVFEGGDLLRHFSLLRNVNPAEPGHGFGEITDDILALVKAGQERIPILTNAQGVPLRTARPSTSRDRPASTTTSPPDISRRNSACPPSRSAAPITTRSRSTSPAPAASSAMPRRTTFSVWRTGRWRR